MKSHRKFTFDISLDDNRGSHNEVWEQIGQPNMTFLPYDFQVVEGLLFASFSNNELLKYIIKNIILNKDHLPDHDHKPGVRPELEMLLAYWLAHFR